MQRVRIGLTGLGFVFVAVLLAAALTSAPQSEAPVNGIVAEAPGSAEPKEPLAELGVAPGNADNKGAANAAEPQRVAP